VADAGCSLPNWVAGGSLAFTALTRLLHQSGLARIERDNLELHRLPAAILRTQPHRASLDAARENLRPAAYPRLIAAQCRNCRLTPHASSRIRLSVIRQYLPQSVAHDRRSVPEPPGHRAHDTFGDSAETYKGVIRCCPFLSPMLVSWCYFSA
jgi:hypothetical protein